MGTKFHVFQFDLATKRTWWPIFLLQSFDVTHETVLLCKIFKVLCYRHLCILDLKYHDYIPKGIQVTEQTRICIKKNQRGDNSKSIIVRTLIFVHYTSSWPVLHNCDVASEYSVWFSSYGEVTNMLRMEAMLIAISPKPFGRGICYVPQTFRSGIKIKCCLLQFLFGTLRVNIMRKYILKWFFYCGSSVDFLSVKSDGTKCIPAWTKYWVRGQVLSLTWNKRNTLLILSNAVRVWHFTKGVLSQGINKSAYFPFLQRLSVIFGFRRDCLRSLASCQDYRPWKMASCRHCLCDSASCWDSQKEAESYGWSLQEAIYQAQRSQQEVRDCGQSRRKPNMKDSLCRKSKLADSFIPCVYIKLKV